MNQFESASAAEAAFYEAFSGGDVDAMLAVWDHTEDVVCAHPMSPPLTGFEAVEQSWRQLLSNGERMRVSPRVIKVYVADDLVMHHLWEDIRYGPDLSQSSLILATNAYHRTAEGWRMILHHGSPSGLQPSTGAKSGSEARTVH